MPILLVLFTAWDKIAMRYQNTQFPLQTFDFWKFFWFNDFNDLHLIAVSYWFFVSDWIQFMSDRFKIIRNKSIEQVLLCFSSCGVGVVVAWQTSKLLTWVRFPYDSLLEILMVRWSSIIAVIYSFTVSDSIQFTSDRFKNIGNKSIQQALLCFSICVAGLVVA